MDKFKKTLALLLAIAMIFAFAACGGDTSEEPSGDGEAQEEGAAGLPEELFVTFDGTAVTIGMNINDVIDSIGEQTMPAQTVEPCDPDAEGAEVEYVFDGYQLNTTEEGIIKMIIVDQRFGSGENALFSGKVALGQPCDEIKAILGEDAADGDETYFYYTYDGGNIIIYKDDQGNDTILGYTITIS